jgi:hypothetical protein
MTENIELRRTIRPEETDILEIGTHWFSLKVETQAEEGQIVAIYKPLESMIAGVGKTKEDALKDFIEGFKAIVDHHIVRGTHERFLGKHFKRKNSGRESLWRESYQ